MEEILQQASSSHTKDRCKNTGQSHGMNYKHIFVQKNHDTEKPSRTTSNNNTENFMNYRQHSTLNLHQRTHILAYFNTTLNLSDLPCLCYDLLYSAYPVSPWLTLTTTRNTNPSTVLEAISRYNTTSNQKKQSGHVQILGTESSALACFGCTRSRDT